MYCKYCGQEVNDDAVICIHCGRSLRDVSLSSQADTGSIGWGVLGFFFPLVGLILYLVWKIERPKTANMAGKGALIGVIVDVVAGICYGISLASLLNNAYNTYYSAISFFQLLF
jgi:cell shape-determining protein MreD